MRPLEVLWQEMIDDKKECADDVSVASSSLKSVKVNQEQHNRNSFLKSNAGYIVERWLKISRIE